MKMYFIADETQRTVREKTLIINEYKKMESQKPECDENWDREENNENTTQIKDSVIENLNDN